MSAPMVFSIRPEYARRLIEGSKRWEFRKSMPKVTMGDTALVYESLGPKREGRQRIVAAFTVGSLVHPMTPRGLWDTIETMDPGSHGIDRKEFTAYFGGRPGVAIGVTNVIPLDWPLPDGMRPPQSWARWRGELPAELEARAWFKARAADIDPELDRAPVSLVTLMADRQRGIESLRSAIGDSPFVGFTCDNCTDAAVCRYAFDPYNTHGDCLVSK